MNLLTISNLFPRPDQPTRGMYNARTFAQLARTAEVENLCLVPEWRPWRRRRIAGWRCPHDYGCRTRYVPVPHVPVLGRPCSWRLYRRALRRHAAETMRSADAVLVSWLYPDGAAAARYVFEKDIPVWVMALGTDTSHLRKPLQRRAILRAAVAAAGIVCVCEELAERLRKAGVAPDTLHVVPNGVDTDVFRYRGRDAARAATVDGHGFGRDDKLILFVGNLVHVKGPDVLLDAFARLRAEDARYRLAVVGQGPMEQALRRRAARIGGVSFLGTRPQTEIGRWMNAADCLVLSSRSEGMPNVVMEALASGLPVVATDVGCCRRLLADEKLARVVPAGAAECMAEEILEIGRLMPDRAAMAARHASYTWRDQAKRILALMRGE